MGLHPNSMELSADQIMFAPGEGPDHPALVPIFALWNEKRANRSMPDRQDMTPRDMKAYLDQVQLYEVIDGGNDFRIRLMGSDFCRTMGYDPTGQCVSQLTDPVLRERVHSAARRVVETGCPVRTAAPAAAMSRVGFRRIERILLPLGSGNEVTHILCQALRIDRLPPKSDPHCALTPV